MNASNNIQTAPFAVNTSAGGFSGRVSSEWFSRPDDQKFLDLDSLYAYTKASADSSFHGVINVKDIEVRADPGKGNDDMRFVIPDPRVRGEAWETHPNHWSFGQMCSLVKTPASYMRRLPGTIAGINMQYAMREFRQESVKAYMTQNGGIELRAATGPDYGRIHDYEVVDAVRKIAGDGTGRDGMHWKVPGVMDWHSGQYDPNAPITRESTTLFASDRDVFLFLVDDRRPIEIGTFTDRNGVQQPDLIYRGFYVWNSEVGKSSLGIATFYLRGVCQNRCLWGVEGFQQIKLRHSKNAPYRFAAEAAPALESFSNNNTAALMNGIESARGTIVAKDNDDAKEFLGRRGKFSESDANAIIKRVTEDEGRPPRSIWDFVQGITAHAKERGHQDARLQMERVAGAMLDKVA